MQTYYNESPSTMSRVFYLVLAIASLKTIHGYECGTHYFDAEIGGYIQSPNFPQPYPDGPYNCTYIITNKNGGNVKLEFSDCISHYMFSYQYYCREHLWIYERDENVTDHTLEGYCASFLPIFHRSTTNTIVVRFEITQTNLFKLPGFKAKYSSIPRDADSSNWYETGYIDSYGRDFYDKPYLLHPWRTENLTSVDIDVIKAAPGHRIALVIGPFHEETGDIIMEVRDGLTSESPLIQRWTSVPNVTTVFTRQSEYLYYSLRMNESQSVPISYVSFITTSGPCPIGYYKCASNNMCIGTSAVCDGYNHCGDNSDEVHPSLNCSLPITCEYPFPCYNDAWSCSLSYPGVYCSCKHGYKGDKCEYKVEGCPFSCLNGGKCIQYACDCGQTNRHGDLCELEYECDPPCKNGGTCSYSNYCSCKPNFYGDTCEEGYGDGNNYSGKANDLLPIILPIAVISFALIACCVCCACMAKKNQRRQHASNAYQAPPVQSVTLNEVSNDLPPDYNVAVRTGSRDSVDNQQNYDEIDGDDTPPPTYETATKSLRTTVLLNDGNYDTQRSPHNSGNEIPATISYSELENNSNNIDNHVGNNSDTIER
ncbi:uncharacterized protein LOC144437309 [Glandiceps talaboti]